MSLSPGAPICNEDRPPDFKNSDKASPLLVSFSHAETQFLQMSLSPRVPIWNEDRPPDFKNSGTLDDFPPLSLMRVATSEASNWNS